MPDKKREGLPTVRGMLGRTEIPELPRFFEGAAGLWADRMSYLKDDREDREEGNGITRL